MAFRRDHCLVWLDFNTDGFPFQEIDVLYSELGTLKPGASVYSGSEKSVFFKAELSATKAELKKEKNALKKKVGTSSDVLAF